MFKQEIQTQQPIGFHIQRIEGALNAGAQSTVKNKSDYQKICREALESLREVRAELSKRK